ncbi:MAG TPA: hypothetical protein VKL61_11170 [Candidatus Polarisedimenticolia bacterium]|nr:hypothetical protein [Candidatus Polarisedimenticolia bacterium]
MSEVPPLQPTQDSLRNAALLVSLLVLLGGLIVLGTRLAAALRGSEVSRSLVVFRMIAVLGALGGFIAYLRDQPSPSARWDLLGGGFSAMPWLFAVALEEIRRRIRRGTGRDSPPRS